MLQYMGDTPNYTPYGKPCSNTGYRSLAKNGDSFEITSGRNEKCYSYYSYYCWCYEEYCSVGYRDRESCKWAIHAPGAKGIRVTLKNMKVSV